MQGAGTLGLEIANQIKNLNTTIDNILISVGGGGLVSGIGSALKQIFPHINIIGVEPIGAKGMTDSLKKNVPLDKVEIDSIADCLCAPLHLPYSFDVASKVIDQMINISDIDMIESMKFAFKNLKLFLEPACVAGFAALKKINSSKLINQNTLILLCGSNIDTLSWKQMIKTS